MRVLKLILMAGAALVHEGVSNNSNSITSSKCRVGGHPCRNPPPAGAAVVGVVFILMGGPWLLVGAMILTALVYQINYGVKTHPALVNQDNNYTASNQSDSDSRSLSLIQLSYDQEKDICLICLGEDCDILTICCHYFHLKCLLDWTAQRPSCPTCRSCSIHHVSLIHCTQCKVIGQTVNLSDGNAIEQVAKLRLEPCFSSVSNS